MIDNARIMISRQSSSIDVEDLRIFLSEHAPVVTVREVHPGPEMNGDWFLQPALDLAMNFQAAHPYLAFLLASASGSLTSPTAKKIYEKFVRP